MNTLYKGSLLLLIVFLSFGCSMKFMRMESSKDKLERLADWMTGSFDSKEQSQLDSSYLNIHLEMVRIWPENKEGIWLYVEQAASWALEKPYRQRVYHLKNIGCGKEDNLFESKVYTLEKPLRFAGVWKEDNPLHQLNPDSLTEKTGCSIFMTYDECEYVGSTNEMDCKSEFRGASYATSQVNIQKYLLKSWDQGFNEKGEQVWGAVKGPYLFKKKMK